MNSHDQARLIAPRVFVLAKRREKVRPGTSGPAAFTWYTLAHGPDTEPRGLLPVFSPESLDDFIRDHFIKHGKAPHPHLSIDPSGLAEAIDYLRGAGVELVALDPVALSGEGYGFQQVVLPFLFSAAYYSRVMHELHAGLEKLFAENVAGNENWMNDPADLQEIKDRCARRMEAVLLDAHSRAEEWEERHKSHT